MRGVRWSLRGVAVLAAVMAVVLLLALAVMLLWNSLVPELFRGPPLQYWQALGLLLLSRILFGGLRRGSWHGQWRQRTRGRLAQAISDLLPDQRLGSAS